MAKGINEIDIASSADDVWAVVGDFGAIGSWMPGIETCTVDGDVRTIGMSGMEIGEKLVRRDDAARVLAYGIVSGPAPVDHHEATITVTPAGSGSHVTWAVDVEPESMLPLFDQVYGQSLEALKKHVDG